MAGGCTCGTTALGNMGRPGCVYTMSAIATFIVFPRYNEDGERNSFDLSDPATIGQDIRDMIEADGTPFRLFPFPKVENVTVPRTETIYDTAASTQKYRVPGVGGIYTFTAELWDKNAVNAILQELEEMGCADMDFVIVDVAGLIWLRKDSPESTVGYGWKMASGTFDAFKMFATDTTVEKTMFSFDLARYEKMSEGYPLLPSQLGYDGTELEGLIQGYQTATALTTTTVQSIVFTAFGSAAVTNKVKGLLTANFKVYNATTATLITPSGVTEPQDGQYTITIAAQTAGDDLTVRVSGASGYDVAESNSINAL